MELAESYKRAFDGDAIYFMRKAVREFLENIRNVCGAEDKIAQAEEREEQREMEIIHGEIAVERYLWAAIGENMKKNENSEVYLYIPAERFTSARILPGCFFWTLERKENCHTGNPKVFQMVPLTKRPDRMSHQYHNLRVLQNLIPVYCQAGARYEVRYFYHDLPDAGMNEGLLYPFYVILEDRVVLLAVDMEQAISISQRDFVEMYRKKFLQKYRRGGGITPLGKFISNSIGMLQWLSETNRGAENCCFLGYHPFLAEWTDRELLEQVLKSGLDDRDKILEAICADCSRMIHYFTRDGLWEFVETGRYPYYPSEYVRCFTKRERQLIIERMVADIEKEEREFGIIDEKHLCLTKGLGVFVNAACRTGLILHDKKCGSCCLIVEEASIGEAIGTYLRGMRAHEEVYSRETTLEVLKSCLRWLRLEVNQRE